MNLNLAFAGSAAAPSSDGAATGLVWDANDGDAASFTAGAPAAAGEGSAEPAPAASGKGGGKGKKGPPRGGPTTGFTAEKQKELADLAAK